MGRGGMTVYLNLDSGGLRRGVTDASRQLRRFDREGTRSVRNVDRATGRLGTSFKHAARYALGAAGAYVSIQQAQVAIQTTQELGRATNNLSEGFGLSTKTASAFAAVAKARNIDVSSLTMAFKTLSTQIEHARDGTSSSVDAFKKLGISMGDLKGMNTDQIIMRISEGFGKMEGSTQKAAVMSQLLGRGFSKLGFLFRDGKSGLQEYIRMADVAGATMSKMDREKVSRLNLAMLKLKLSQIGLQKSLTLALTPAIEAGAAKMLEFTQILNNPKLTMSQKFNRISDEISRLVTQVIPPAVRAMARHAPRIAAAFVQGFLSADVWGQLTLASLLVAKFGSKAAVGKLGQMYGTVFGKRFALGLEAGMILAVIVFRKQISDAVQWARDKVESVPIFGGIVKSLNDALPGFDVFNRRIYETGKRSEGASRKLREVGRAGKQAGNQTAGGAQKANKALDSTANRAQSAAKTQREGFRKAWASIASNAQSATRRVNSAQGSVASQARSKAASSRSAWSALGSIFDTVRGKAESLLNTLSNIASQAASLPGKAFRAVFGQRGGPIFGTGSGDIIPAMLEPGEFVMNRNAVAAYGLETMHAMNSAVPRFASGGKVQGLRKGGKPKNPGYKKGPNQQLTKLESDLAGAELTFDDTKDDAKALNALIAYWQGVIDKPPRISYGKPKWDKKKKRWIYPRSVINYQALTEARNQKRAYQEQLAQLEGTDTSQTELNAQLQQMVQNQRDLLNVSQSQYGVLVQAMAAAVSGHIGGKIGLGMQAPAVAGRVASY